MKAIVASKTALKSIPLEKKRRIRGLLIFVYSTHSYGFFVRILIIPLLLWLIFILCHFTHTTLIFRGKAIDMGAMRCYNNGV